MQKYLTLAVFVALIAFQYLYIADQQRAIEIVSITFFAALGAMAGTFDLAKYWLSRNANGAAEPVFKPWLQPRLLLIWPICGLSLSGGGGIVRRALEIGTAAVLLTWWDIRLLNCYDPPLAVLWAWGHPYYFAVGVGVLSGAVLSFALTFRISDAAPVESRIDDLVRAVDNLVSAFFAAYGIEAAMKFSSALPFGPASWSALSFLLLVAFLSFASGMLMASGGGLLRGVLINILLCRFRNIFCVFANWFAVLKLYVYGGIAALGFVMYELLDRSPLGFGQCPLINTQHMFWTMIFCALVGICTYVMLED